MHEWPLIIFTLLVQASVGLTLFIGCSALGRHPDFRALRKALIVACVCGGVGLLASVAHLGYPLNAFNSLRHYASSWLSREIIFAALFLGLLGLTTLLALMTRRVVAWLAMLAGLVGLADVYCMSNIYINSAVVTWMHVNTLFMFYGSVLILGAVLAMNLIAPRGRAREGWNLPGWAAIAVIIAVAARLIVQPLYMGFLQQHVGDNVTFPLSALAAFDALASVRMTSWIIMALGAGLFAHAMRKERIARGYVVTGSLLLVVAEVLARFTFFSLN